MIASEFILPIEAPPIVTPMVEKSAYSGYGQSSFYDYLYSRVETIDLAMRHSLNLYAKVSPFATATNKIAKAIESIDFKVQDIKTGEFIEHDVLELLKNPNAEQSDCEFKLALTITFSVTGNAFLFASGLNVNRPPLEIYCLMPQRVIPLVETSQSISNAASRYEVISIRGLAVFF